MQSIAALTGIAIFIGIAWGLSFRRALFPWRTVASGLLIQVVFAVLILRTEAGRWMFDLAQGAVNRLLGFAGEGARMVFGPLADGALLADRFGPENAYVFAVGVSATIIVVAAISALLYHWGILQRVVAMMAWVMQRLMRTSGSESLAAAANIFMGQTEAPLVIRPYLARMTRSELMALMTGGMATIAGGVGAVYVGLGVRAGELNMAGHLLTASVMSAPAALLIAKVMLPETETSETAGSAPLTTGRDTSNAVDALCRGAGEGMMLSINVIAMMIAFVAVVAIANFIFGSAQTWVGIDTPRTLQELVGWINAPLAWLMGVPWKDCPLIGGSLGERIVLNEFIGYTSLAAQRPNMEPRSFVIASYALCGFANFGSIAIQIGGIGALAPERRGDFAALGARAMIGGVLASYITASIAGLVMPA